MLGILLPLLFLWILWILWILWKLGIFTIKILGLLFVIFAVGFIFHFLLIPAIVIGLAIVIFGAIQS